MPEGRFGAMALPVGVEDKLYATISLQNSESFLRIALTFQECSLQTEVLNQLAKLLESFAEALDSFGHKADADYATRGINSLQKFKEQVIQSYLGRPTEHFGASPKETKECQARTGAHELGNADADADGDADADADGDVRDVPMSLPSMPPPSGRSLQLSWNFSDLSNRNLSVGKSERSLSGTVSGRGSSSTTVTPDWSQPSPSRAKPCERNDDTEMKKQKSEDGTRGKVYTNFWRLFRVPFAKSTRSPSVSPLDVDDSRDPRSVLPRS